MLELQRVSKSFDRPLFHELSLTIGRGDRLALTGPSGCGKTTLLGILLGIVKPDGGAVRRDGPLHLSAVFQEDRLRAGQYLGASPTHHRQADRRGGAVRPRHRPRRAGQARQRVERRHAAALRHRPCAATQGRSCRP